MLAGGRTRRRRILEANLNQRLANPPSRLGYLQQLYAATGWSSHPWLRRVRHRTLIVHGDQDPLLAVITRTGWPRRCRTRVCTWGRWSPVPGRRAQRGRRRAQRFPLPRRLMRSSLLYNAYETRRRLLAPLYATTELQAASLRALPKPIAALPAHGCRRRSPRPSGLAADPPSAGLRDQRGRRRGRGSCDRAVPRRHGVRQGRPLRQGQPPDTAQGPAPAGPGRTLRHPGTRHGPNNAARPRCLSRRYVHAATSRCKPGRFGLDEFIDHIIDFLRAIGPGTHLMAICQPCAAAVTAAAVMAANEDPAQPEA